MYHSFSSHAPTNRAFLSTAFASFHKAPTSLPHSSEPSSNPFNAAPPNIKPLLITLHVLFPNELLSALDLLDRGSVTRLIFSTDGSRPGGPENVPKSSHDGDMGSASEERNDAEVDGRRELSGKSRTVHYVQSSHQPHTRSRFASASSRAYDVFLARSRQSYEVRLKAWNCSCPAFAFASVECMMDECDGLQGTVEGDVTESAEGNPRSSGCGKEDEDQSFGGLLREKGDMPVCKHLLACFLAESWTEISAYVAEDVLGSEEMSGWAAGWGGLWNRMGSHACYR